MNIGKYTVVQNNSIVADMKVDFRTDDIGTDYLFIDFTVLESILCLVTSFSRY